jgi:alpha-mannosidase
VLKHPEITERRIRQFAEHSLKPLVHGEPLTLTIEYSEESHADERSAREASWRSVSPGFSWGPAWRTVWFRVTGTVPKEWEGSVVVARLDLGGERIVWKDNVPTQGLDGFHQDYRIQSGGDFELYVQATGDNPDVRVHGLPPNPNPEPFVVGNCDIRIFDEEVFQLYTDCIFYLDLLQSLSENDPAREHLLRGLNLAANLFDPEVRETIADARRAIADGAKNKRRDEYHVVTAVGHAHLDTAWLWPLSITKIKMAHTTASQLALMDQYPEHVFVHSQAAQYEWLELEYPELFRKVVAKVKEGKWEALGSMWVEADTNLAGGEALIRQFLYGKKYFLEKLGIDTKDMWLPDVFGYSAALPQILRKCNIDRFLTQKISWNQFNKFPHHTFWWQGIDGTRVWSHFLPADTYIGQCKPSELRKHLTNYKDAARCDHSLYVFGWGDGGGGPTRDHLEFLRRATDSPGVPQIQIRRAKDFFDEAIASSKDLAVWVGELYFELHRGTYTTQASTKKNNRRCEFLIRDAEYLCAASELPYPAEKLEGLWKKVLLNQFHDILPGSSVREVYEDASRDYAYVIQETERIVKECMEAATVTADTEHMACPIALFQFARCSSEKTIPAVEGCVANSVVCEGKSAAVQTIDHFDGKKWLFQVPEAALGTVAVADFRSEAAPVAAHLKAVGRSLENEFWKLEFDESGNLSNVISRADGTEFVAEGEPANRFQLFEDKPLFWSAWDVEIFALETGKYLDALDRFEIVESGPVRVAAEIERKFGKSKIIQRISLGQTAGIRFDTTVEWAEADKMLKVAFPVNVNATRATYEIQYGNIERPTHVNTSWDLARFEVCAHKWVDLSEGGRGVALLNDGKYGHDIRDNVIRLTLLRSPKAPDPTADMGLHHFSYILLPHGGSYAEAGAVDAAYALNAAVHAQPLGKKPGESLLPLLFVGCDATNLVIESVKRAEDGSGTIIRVYDAHNCRGRALLRFSKEVRSAALCDLLENELAPLEPRGREVSFDYKPFEIVTIKVAL